jgi:hypothetical protein
MITRFAEQSHRHSHAPRGNEKRWTGFATQCPVLDGVCNPMPCAGRGLQPRPRPARDETLRTGLQTPSGKKRYGRGCKPRPARNVTDGVANPVRQEMKRYGRGCKPRPAYYYFSRSHAPRGNACLDAPRRNLSKAFQGISDF